MKRNLLITLLSIIFLSTTTVFAHEGRWMHKGNNGRKGQHNMMRKGNRNNMMFKELNLSVEQEAKIEAIRTKYIKKSISLEADSKKIKIDKQSAMKSNEFSKAKNLSDKLADLRGEIQKNRISEKEEIWNQLSSDQKKKTEEFRRNRPFERGSQNCEFRRGRGMHQNNSSEITK